MWILGVAGGGRVLELAEWMLVRGVENYVPMSRIEKRVRHVRKPVVSVRPAFGSYIFLRDGLPLWNSYRAANERGLIAGVHCMDDEPVRVPERVVERLRASEARGAFDNARSLLRIKVGDEVEVVEGPLEGMKGTVALLHHGNGKRVTVEIVGREVNLHISKLLICSPSLLLDDRDDPERT